MAGESSVAAKPVKKLIEARVGAADDEAARKLAEKKSIAIADVYSQAIERGLPILIEEDNKMSWWLEASTRLEFIKALESVPKERLAEALELLRGLNK